METSALDRYPGAVASLGEQRGNRMKGWVGVLPLRIRPTGFLWSMLLCHGSIF
jgi:hypothetical protein